MNLAKVYLYHVLTQLSLPEKEAKIRNTVPHSTLENLYHVPNTKTEIKQPNPLWTL